MTVRQLIEEKSEDFTSSERKLSAALLADYPFGGLEPIQTLASKTSVSSPSISRFITKLGFSGYQDFQQSLIAELKEGQKSPVDLHETRRGFQGAFLEGFMSRASQLLDETTQIISESQFDQVCQALARENRSIYLIGGRMSDVVSQYLARHLRQFRPKVYHIPSDPEIWPEYLLRMKPKDILFICDFRRYQRSLELLAEKAHKQRNAQIILMTDTWLSPIAKHASDVLPVPIDSGTIWDSYTAGLAIAEALITRITEANWQQTKDRIEAWDAVRLNLGDPSDDI